MNYSLKSSFYEEINTRLEDKSTSKERKNILKMVLTAVEYLSSSNIYIYPNIIELFKVNGFKNATLYFDAICYIIEKIKNEFKDDFEWINHRSLKKTSRNDKNIIICFLLYTYREHFIRFMQDYLIKNKINNVENIENIITKLQRFIDDIPNNNINIQITINTK